MHALYGRRRSRIRVARKHVEAPTAEPEIEECVGCPLLAQNTEAWIRCCTSRFLPLARSVAGDDVVAHDALQESWIIVLQAPAVPGRSASMRLGGGDRAVRDVHRLMAERRELPLDGRSVPLRGAEAGLTGDASGIHRDRPPTE